MTVMSDDLEMLVSEDCGAVARAVPVGSAGLKTLWIYGKNADLDYTVDGTTKSLFAGRPRQPIPCPLRPGDRT